MIQRNCKPPVRQQTSREICWWWYFEMSGVVKNILKCKIELLFWKITTAYSCDLIMSSAVSSGFCLFPQWILLWFIFQYFLTCVQVSTHLTLELRDLVLFGGLALLQESSFFCQQVYWALAASSCCSRWSPLHQIAHTQSTHFYVLVFIWIIKLTLISFYLVVKIWHNRHKQIFVVSVNIQVSPWPNLFSSLVWECVTMQGKTGTCTNSFYQGLQSKH